MDNNLLSIRKAAEYLDVTEDCLRKWDKDGKLKPFKTAGGHRRYKQEDLDKFVGINEENVSNSMDLSSIPNDELLKEIKRRMKKIKQKSNMKKIFMAIALCLVCAVNGFGETYDILDKDMFACDSITWKINEIHMLHFSNVNINNNTPKQINTKYVPDVVYDRYMFGEKLMKSGWINFGIGLSVAAIGGILLVAKDVQTQTISQIKAGDALLGIGGTLLSVSIPLLCFGDEAKREANVDYEVFNLLCGKIEK